MHLDGSFFKRVSPELIVRGTLPTDISFSVDTRVLQEGQFFIALAGARTDGHDFLLDALKKGAAGIVVALSQQARIEELSKKVLGKAVVMLVQDPLNALFAWAHAWRNLFSIPVVGITGSVGKTSTKEILSSIVAEHGMAYIASTGSQNTKIGLSLDMLRLKSHHRVGLFEVGINKRGEMAGLVEHLRPTIGLITYIGHSHMEGLGSLADIAIEKRTIFKLFQENSIGIVNGDQQLLADVSYAHPVIKFGLKTTNQVQARKVEFGVDTISFGMKIYKKKFHVTLKTAHEGAVNNVLAATAAATLLAIPEEVIVQAIQKPVLVPSRFERKEIAAAHGKGTLIDDCFNANPESMKAALLAFGRIKTESKKIAVLADMLELGVNGQFWHRQLGRFLRKVPSISHVILVGSMVQWTRRTLPINVSAELVLTWQEALVHVQRYVKQKDTIILVKGSRGMGLKNMVNELV